MTALASTSIGYINNTREDIFDKPKSLQLLRLVH